eukprot:3620186-Prymnesium_polylepis.1
MARSQAAPCTLSKQKPNAACGCGSGKKYKKCCALTAINIANKTTTLSGHSRDANSINNLIDQLRVCAKVTPTTFDQDIDASNASDLLVERFYEGSSVIFMGWPYSFTSAEVCNRLREQVNIVVVDVTSWSKNLVLEAFRSCNPRETYYMQMTRENFETFIDVQISGQGMGAVRSAIASGSIFKVRGMIAYRKGQGTDLSSDADMVGVLRHLMQLVGDEILCPICGKT